MLNSGVEHILHQVVDAKMYTEFLPKITEYIQENRGQLYKVCLFSLLNMYHLLG